jgi:hypothetical protein
VFLTLGGDGVLYYRMEESPLTGDTRHPGYDIQPVDTTGAGDAFHTGVIASMTHGVMDPERVLEVANALGGVVTTKPGSQTALSDTEPSGRIAGRYRGSDGHWCPQTQSRTSSGPPLTTVGTFRALSRIRRANRLSARVRPRRRPSDPSAVVDAPGSVSFHSR